jgi:hypothetical protein
MVKLCQFHFNIGEFMSKILRKVAKIFGSNAGTDQIAQFGSLAAADPTFTTDPIVIQSLSNYLGGWFSGVIGSNSPAIEDMNALCYLYAYQIAYNMQAGVPEWDASTTYYIGSFVSDGNGNLYYSLIDNNLNNVVSNLTDWKIFLSPALGNAISIIEPLEQKSENEHYGIIADPLDNSISSGFNQDPGSYYNQGILLQSTTGTAGSAVWSPVVLNNAAKDTTTTTNWSNVANTTTLTTSATTQVGATSVSFTKSATGLASIKYDYGALGFFVPNNTRLWFWINLANLTGFSSVNITLSADATTYGTNFETWTLTTNYAGSPIATGWNLCFLDVSTVGTATGTGWNSKIAARFFTIGINTSSSASTVILINGIYFSYSQPSQDVPLGSELTVFDGTHSENFQIDSSNTQVDGLITLTNSLVNTYAGGFVGASVYRSSLTIGNNQALLGTLDSNGNTLSGAITTSQAVRLSRVLKTALSSNTLTASATVNTSQVYSISSTTTNVIVVNDSVNQIANLLIGDVLHVFSSNYADGIDDFIYLGDFTLTSNATNTNNLTTLTGTGGVPVGTLAGGYVAKKHITASYSAVTITSNESFSTLSPMAAPTGIILLDNGLKYPYPQNVWAHYPLGNPYTIKNIYGAGPTLTQVGSLTYNSIFKNGQYAASGWSSSNYLNDGLGVSPLDGTTNTKFAVSIWYYPTSNAASKVLIGHSNNSTTGWDIGIGTSVTNTITVGINSGTAITSTPTLSMNNWNHIFLNYSAGVTFGTTLWLNGVCVGNSTSTISANTNNLSIGVVSTNSAPLTSTDQVADAILWAGVNLSQIQIQQIYNNGIAIPVGFGPYVKYRYQANLISGQRLTYKLALITDTAAVTPSITQAGIIKTS